MRHRRDGRSAPAPLPPPPASASGMTASHPRTRPAAHANAPPTARRGAQLLLLLAAALFLLPTSPLLPSISVMAQPQELLSTYPIIWSQVSTTPSTTKNLTANCICDLSSVQCDLGCCCDTTCPAGLTAQFTSAGTCLPEGPPTQTLRYCTQSSFVERVNLPANSDFYYITIQAANTQFVQSLLCISSSSNPDLGKAYPDPPAGDVGDNAALAICPLPAAVPLPSTVYGFERQILVQRTSSTAQQLTGTLQVPYPAFSSVCNDQFAVGFLVPTPISTMAVSSSCQRLFATPADTLAACSADSPLSPSYWTKLAFYPAPIQTGSPVQVTVVTMQYLSPTTGALSALIPSNVSSAYSAASGVCSLALLSLNITILYSVTATTTTTTTTTASTGPTTGVIVEILMDLILTDFLGATNYTTGSSDVITTNVVMTNTTTNGNVTVNGTSTTPTNGTTTVVLSNTTTTTTTTSVAAGVVTNVPGFFEQSVTVGWLKYSSATDVAAAATPTVLVSYSGNPGYLPGFPLLAGVLTTMNSTGQSAISRFVQGMPLPAPVSEGLCGAGGLAPVGFGFNVSSTCAVSHTLASLSTFCNAQANNPQYYVAAALNSVYDAIVDNELYVGIWGNSAINNTNQWIQVSVSNAPSLSLTLSGSSCGNIIVGYDLQVLWGVAFAANNLQSKVLYVNLCFKLGTWTYPVSLANQSTPVRFFMNYTTTFIALDQSGSAYQVKKPAPPLAAPLPFDIFYPFLISSSAPPSAAPPSAAGVLVVASLAATLLLLLARL